MEQLARQQEELINWLSPRKTGRSETTTVMGTALSDSDKGKVAVELPASVLSEDSENDYGSKTAIVELPTTVYCKEGDSLIISAFGVNGVKTPTVTGVSGGGDRMQGEIEEGGGGGGNPLDGYVWVRTDDPTRNEILHITTEYNEPYTTDDLNYAIDLNCNGVYVYNNGRVIATISSDRRIETRTELLRYSYFDSGTEQLLDYISGFHAIEVFFTAEDHGIPASSTYGNYLYGSSRAYHMPYNGQWSHTQLIIPLDFNLGSGNEAHMLLGLTGNTAEVLSTTHSGNLGAIVIEQIVGVYPD